MTIRLEAETIFLEGRCAAEDAETLLVALQENPGIGVDASGLLKLHLAVAQVLLATKPRVVAAPTHEILAASVFAPIRSLSASPLPSGGESA